jgi:hypothetical protein
MPEKPTDAMIQAIEGYYGQTMKYRDKPTCNALKADCWQALMAYHAMYDVAPVSESCGATPQHTKEDV